jgi:solute carrier family 66 (lysosomal lysine-arginine transporter), member 1
LAVYYTLADIVLLGQCFYYEGFTLQDKVVKRNGPPTRNREGEALLDEERNAPSSTGYGSTASETAYMAVAVETHHDCRGSTLERILSVDPTHLSPVHPLVPDPKPNEVLPKPNSQPQQQSTLRVILFNLFSVILVCAAGVLGWYLGDSGSDPSDQPFEPLEFNFLGQVFGYICAILYLASRIPQLLLNYRRKSTEGISMLFFLFACIGNVTYVLSIMAYDPPCVDGSRHCKPGEAASIYVRYFLVNFSWILGSFGSLLLDLGVFVQFFMYLKDEDDFSSDEDDESEGVEEGEGAVVVRRGGRHRVVYE